MANKFLDQDGLLYLWSKIKAAFVAKETGKGLSTNDYTTDEKNKLAGIAAGAEVNVQSDWNATTGDAAILNKPTIPSKTSQLTNDSGFITGADVPEGAAASTTAPKMDGTAAVGTEMAFARGDHVHPSDTSRVPVTRTINGKALSADVTLAAGDVGARPNTWTPTATDVGARPNTWTPSASDVGAIPTSAKGSANGVASLDADGKVPSTQLPSYVDDIVEGYYYNGKFYKEAAHTSEITGESGKIYVDVSTNLSYRYGGSAFVQITSSDMTKITNAEIDTIVAS